MLITAPAVCADTSVSELYFFPQHYLWMLYLKYPRTWVIFSMSELPFHLFETQMIHSYLECLCWNGYVISKLCIQISWAIPRSLSQTLKYMQAVWLNSLGFRVSPNWFRLCCLWVACLWGKLVFFWVLVSSSVILGCHLGVLNAF